MPRKDAKMAANNGPWQEKVTKRPRTCTYYIENAID
jgi:hypothetical protein